MIYSIKGKLKDQAPEYSEVVAVWIRSDFNTRQAFCELAPKIGLDEIALHLFIYAFEELK